MSVDKSAIPDESERLLPELAIGASVSLSTPLLRILQPGQLLGHYRICARIGSGGMGVVYEAIDMRLARRVAVKILRADVRDAASEQPLLAEARAAACLEHQCFVRVYALDMLENGLPYMVMEYLEGMTLRDWLQVSRPLRAVLQVFAAVAEGMAYAHGRGIVHRDLKPENIFLLRDDTVKILDLGLAGLSGPAGSSTVARAELPLLREGRIGTPRYFSPETWRGAPPTAQVDVWAIGVMLYEALHGNQHPFWLSAQSLEANAERVLAASEGLTSILDPRLPLELASIVRRALARDLSRRYADAGQLFRELRGFLETEPGETSGRSEPPTPPNKRVGAPRLRLWLAIAGALGTALLTGALLTGRSWQRRATSLEVMAPRPKAMTEAVVPPPSSVQHGIHQRVLDVILEGLRDREPLLREKALKALALRADPMTRPLIEPLLRDSDGRVQAAAAHALGRMGSLAAKKALLLRVHSITDSRVVLAFIDALHELGSSEADFRLRALAKDPDADVRLGATLLRAYAGDGKSRRPLLSLVAALPASAQVPVLGRLARSRNRQAYAALRKLLPAEARTPLHLQIADALLTSGDEQARSVLESAAKKEGPLQLLAARLLAEHDDPSFHELFRRQLAGEQPIADRSLAVEGLGAGRLLSDVPILAALLPEASGPLRLRLSAASALLLILSQDSQQLALDTLLWIERTLSDSRWSLRQQATVPLRDADPRVALPLLFRASVDTRAEVRRSAAQSLGHTHSQAAVPLLRKLLSDDAASVREEALSAAGELGLALHKQGENDPALVEEIAARSGHGSPIERVRANGALTDLGDARGVPALIESLRSPLADVRFLAAWLLTERGHREGVNELQVIARGAEPRATMAAGLLRRLGATSERISQQGLQSTAVAVRAAAITELGQLPAKDALPWLRSAVHDPALAVRRALVLVAARMTLEGAVGARSLVQLLSRDSDAQVRAHAGIVLSGLGRGGAAMDDARQALAAYLRGDYSLAMALGEHAKTPLSLYAAAAAACAANNAETARTSYARLSDASARRQLVSRCGQRGIPLPRTVEEAQLSEEDQQQELPGIGHLQGRREPSPPRRLTKAAILKSERKKTLRNQDIRLPQRVSDAIPSLTLADP